MAEVCVHSINWQLIECIPLTEIQINHLTKLVNNMRYLRDSQLFRVTSTKKYQLPVGGTSCQRLHGITGRSAVESGEQPDSEQGFFNYMFLAKAAEVWTPTSDVAQ